ncbi:MAG: hypothetical protein ACPGXK_15310 [Phycisphaerae bacterium]
MTQKPNTKCIRCHYRLDGVPVDHACPECGLAYDADVRIYRVVSFTWFYALIAICLTANAGLQLYLFVVGRLGNQNLYSLIIATLWWLVVSIYLTPRAIKQRQIGAVAAILPQGLFFRNWRFDDRLIVWSSIESIAFTRFKRGTDRIEIKLTDGSAIRHDSPPPGGTAARTEFVREVQRRLDRLSQSPIGDTVVVESQA